MKTKLIILLMFLFFIGLGGLMIWRYQIGAIRQETATNTLFRPYFDNVLHGRLEDAYENFTDDYYKSEFALDDYLAAHDQTLKEDGKFIGYELHSAQDCSGIFSFRTTLCVRLDLKFERGGEKLMHYQIQQDVNNRFRIRYAGTYSNKRVDGFPF